MFKNAWLFIFPCLFLSGCSIHGSMQGLYGYYDKTAEASPGLLQKTTEPVCSLKVSEEPAIIVINGKALQPCLKQYEKALLYIWKPKCSSDKCIPLNVLQGYADKRKWELFIVAEYYDQATMNTLYDIKRPIFGVDCPYYGSNMTSKYLSRFMNDVLETEHGYEEGNTFYLFKNGQLSGKSGDVKALPDA